MKMFKYLLLSVVSMAGSLLKAQEPVVANTEDAVMAKSQEPVVVRAENPVAANVQETVTPQAETPVEPQPVVADRELPQSKDEDFAEMAKQLDMSDEEISQFLAEMDNEMAQEKSSDVAQEKTVPEVKGNEVTAELPEAIN